MNRTKLSRSLAVALLGTSLFGLTVPAFSQGHHGPGGRGFGPGVGPGAGQMTDADRTQMRERMQAGAKQRLDRMAARLEIKASQQDAWTAYRKARESIFATPPQFPAADADAATLTRFRAEMAKRRADHMAVMADATGKLQAVLDPSQRKVLDEMSRRGGGRGPGHGGPRGFGGHRGHADGQQMHQHGRMGGRV